MIVITRSQKQAAAFSKILKGAGISCLIESVLEIVPLSCQIPDFSNYQGIIVTSANAVENVRGVFENPVYTVGAQTQRAVMECGFSNVMSAHGNTDNLVDLIVQQNIVGSLLYIRGRDVAADIKMLLAARGIHVDEIITYQTQKIECFSDDFVHCLEQGQIEAVTFFSKRSAMRFADLSKKMRLDKHLRSVNPLCISEGVLECLDQRLWGEGLVAHVPDRDGMVALIKENYKVMEDI